MREKVTGINRDSNNTLSFLFPWVNSEPINAHPYDEGTTCKGRKTINNFLMVTIL